MNKLLSRQIQKHFGEMHGIPDSFKKLLEVISESYDHYEKDRKLIERSIELTSNEMIELNNELRKDKSDLKKAHKELSTLFENIDEVLFSVDMVSYKLTQMSAACEKVYGYTQAEFFADSELWRKVIHPEDKYKIAEQLDALNKGRQISNQYRIINKDNTIRWLENNITPTLDEAGQLIRIDGITSDISSRKSAEIELEKSFSIIEATLESTADGILVVDNNGKIVRFNNKFLELWRMPRETLDSREDKKSIEFVLDQLVDPSAFVARVQELYDNQEEVDFDLVHFKDGRVLERYSQPQLIKKKYAGRVWSFRDITERKKSEIELAESENRFRTILEAEPECIKLLGSSGEILMMNPAGLAMIEADNVEQVVGKPVLGIILPEHRSAFSKTIESVFKGKSKKLVFEIKGLKGTHRWLETHAVPMKNELGEVVSLLGVTRDITERKKTEQEKNSLQTTLENSLNEIYIFDAETLQFSYINKGALLNLGYSKEEIKHLTPIDLKPDFTVSSFKSLVIPLVKKEKLKIVFFTNHKRKDGSLYPVEVHLQLVADDSYNRFLAIVLDITERKKAEESILKANERFEKVTEATNDVIWDWDMINQTFYRSKAIENFFGKDAPKSFSESDFWKDSFHPDDTGAVQDSVNEAISNPLTNRWESEYRIVNENGKVLYVIDRGVIVRNQEGKAIRMVGAMTDISEQKQMALELKELNQSLEQYTNELERSNEELEQFAFVTSHDLQEPLRMISSFMDLLKRKYENKLDEKAHQYIHFAIDGAKRMKQIILDLLDYSRATRPTEGIEEVNMNEVLSEFIQLRRKLISEKSAKIKSNELPTLDTHKAAVTQILHCLIDNALKYSKEGIPPIIKIKALEREKEWEFSIKDNGIGIDPQFYEKIFVIFQRLHNNDKYTGTGIGLSIAKRHIEFLKGQIWLEPAPREGTIFYFSIPKTK